MSCGRSGVDEVPETLCAEQRERGSDSIQYAFDVDVDHVLPFFDVQFVEGSDWGDAGIIDENVKLAVPIACQLHELGQVLALPNVCAGAGGLAPRVCNSGGQSLKAIQSARPEHNFRTALSKQQRSGLANSTARTRDDNDFAFDS